MNSEISYIDLDCNQHISQSGFFEECEPFQKWINGKMMLIPENKFDAVQFDETNKDFKVVYSANTKQDELGYQYFFHKDNELSDDWLQVFPYLDQIWEYEWSNYEVNYEGLWKSKMYNTFKTKINWINLKVKIIKYSK